MLAEPIMKLTRSSTEKYQLEIKQRFIRFLGLLFVLLCAFIFLMIMMQYEIVCTDKQNHTANQCVLKRTIFYLSFSNTPLGHLREARVERTYRKSQALYGLYLYSDSGPINLSMGNSIGQQNKEIAASKINAFIYSSGEKSMIIPYPPSLFFILINTIFCTVGFILLSIEDTKIIFDKGIQTATINRKNIWNQTQEMKLPLSDVDKIIIEENSSRYRMAIAMKNKPSLPLTSNYDSSYLNKEHIAKELNEFIQST